MGIFSGVMNFFRVNLKAFKSIRMIVRTIQNSVSGFRAAQKSFKGSFFSRGKTETTLWYAKLQRRRGDRHHTALFLLSLKEKDHFSREPESEGKTDFSPTLNSLKAIGKTLQK